MITAVFADVGQPWRLGEGVSLNDNTLPIIDVEIDAVGNTAIQQAISYVPGKWLWIDENGVAVIEDRNTGQERAMVEQLAKDRDPVFDTRTPVVQRHQRRRPAEVHVLWTPEIELRATYVEDLGQDTSLVTVVSDTGKEEDPLKLECVVRVPDAQINIPAGFGREGRTVNQGAYVAVEEYIAAINADPRVAQTRLEYTFSLQSIRDTWMIPGFLQTLLTFNNRVPDRILNARYQAIREAFRSRYQFQPRLRHLLHSWNVKRVSIMDVETGNRNAGQVYSDWAQQFSIVGRVTDPNGLRLFQNYEGAAVRLQDGNVAPALVSVEDDQLGVMRVTFVPDLYGITGAIFPGKLEGKFIADLPTTDPRNERRGRSGTRPELARLESGYQADIVFSVIPAVPNDITRLVPVPMGPSDVADILGRNPGTSEGPILQARVSPQVDTARYAWEDSKREQYVEALQDNRLPPIGTLVNARVITEFSRALAASVYAQWVDRIEGSLTTAWKPDIRPVGNVTSVSHLTDPDAGDGDGHQAMTMVSATPELPGIDPMALMKEGERAVLIREPIRE